MIHGHGRRAADTDADLTRQSNLPRHLRVVQKQTNRYDVRIGDF